VRSEYSLICSLLALLLFLIREVFSPQWHGRGEALSEL
jgi:hypothetical protein